MKKNALKLFNEDEEEENLKSGERGILKKFKKKIIKAYFKRVKAQKKFQIDCHK